MLRKLFFATVCSLPIGCANLPVKVPDTARLAPGQLGSGADADVYAVHLAQWAFADPGRVRGRPVDAARASAAMDYIAGELYTSPRWANIPAVTQEQLLQGRQEVRDALGVVPGAPSQAVVDDLTMAADALAHNDHQAALRQLGPPVFALPPQQVLARLSYMPYLPKANIATMRAANEMFGPGNMDWH